jgi:hypothetical protein
VSYGRSTQFSRAQTNDDLEEKFNLGLIVDRIIQELGNRYDEIICCF